MMIVNSALLLLALGVVAGEFNPSQVCNVCESANQEHFPNVMLTGIKIDGKTQVTCAGLYSYTNQVTAEQMDICENIQRRYRDKCCDTGVITPAMVMELIEAMALNDKLSGRSRSNNMNPSTSSGSCYLCQGGVAVVSSSAQLTVEAGGLTCSSLHAQLPNWYAERRIDTVECGRQQARYSSVCCPPNAVLDGSNPIGNVQEAYFNQMSQTQPTATLAAPVINRNVVPGYGTFGSKGSKTSKGNSYGSNIYSGYQGTVYTPLSRNIPGSDNPYATTTTEYSTFTGNQQQFNSMPTTSTSTVTASGGVFTVTQIQPTIEPVPATGTFTALGGGKRTRHRRRRRA